MDAGEAAAAPAAHTAELQAVKLRAVKKIRGLEDKLKALSEELEAARQHANEPGRRQGAEAEAEMASVKATSAIQQRILCTELSLLEQAGSESSALYALEMQLAMQQQEVVESKYQVEALRQTVDEEQARRTQEVAALMRQLHDAQEVKQKAELERTALAAQLESATREVAEAGEVAQREAAKWQAQEAAQAQKIAKLKALLSEARVLIKSGKAAEANGKAAEVNGGRSDDNGVGGSSQHQVQSGDEVGRANHAALHMEVERLKQEVRRLEGVLDDARPSAGEEALKAEAAAAATAAAAEAEEAIAAARAQAREQSEAALALRRELTEMRTKARKLMESKDAEVTRQRNAASEAQAKAAEAARALRAAEAKVELEAAARVAAERALAAAESEPESTLVRGGTRGLSLMASEAPASPDTGARAGAVIAVAVAETPTAQRVDDGPPPQKPNRYELSLLGPTTDGTLGDAAASGSTADAGHGDASARHGASMVSSTGGSAETFLHQLAQQQAARDAQVSDIVSELEMTRGQLRTSEAEVERLRRRVREEEMRDVRSTASIDYVKCLVLQLLISDETRHADLFPPLATCLQFSEADVAQVTRAHTARARRGWRALIGGRSTPRKPASENEEGGGGGGDDFTVAAQRAVSERQATELQVNLARKADRTAIRSLVCELAKLEAHMEEQAASAALREAARIASLSAEQRSREEEQQQKAKAAADALYLRNVLKSYMETEDHHTMFPVVAMLLKLTQAEVDELAAKRAARERERGGVVRRLLFGS